MGILKPDKGIVSFGEKEATNFPIYQRAREFKIGYVPQYGGYFADLTTYENLKAIAEILIKDERLIDLGRELPRKSSQNVFSRNIANSK